MANHLIPRNEEQKAIELYTQLIDAWNRSDATGFASLFTTDAVVVGFDGTQMNGRTAVRSELETVFRDHLPPPFVTKVQETRTLSPNVVLIRAIAGMVDTAHDDINPALNAVQTAIMVWDMDRWAIAVFQNTPAQFHGRPDLVEDMTSELRLAR